MALSQNIIASLNGLYNPLEEYLQIFIGIPNTDMNELVSFCNHISNEGIPFLSNDEYSQLCTKYGKFKQISAKLSFFSDNKVLLRGLPYYLGYIPALNTAALDSINKNLDKINEYSHQVFNSTSNCETLEERIFLSQALDYRKHYSLLLFTGLFQSMLTDPSIPAEKFDVAYSLCARTIEDYYRYIIQGKNPHTDIPDASSVIEAIIPGKAYTSQRSLSREMDHPGRILIYCANLCKLINHTYDFSLNPLNGAAEVGFALKAVGQIINRNVVDNLSFVRYSTYDEQHEDILGFDDLLGRHVPYQLHDQLGCMKGRRVIIIYDNITAGHTLTNIRRALQNYCATVDISVVEINRENLYELLKKTGKRKRVLQTRELLNAAVGEWRDQRKIIDKIKYLVESSLFGLNDGKA